MTTGAIHMIGNAHIDPVWLWQWQEGFQEVKATFRSMLNRMNEHDDFIFTSSSAAFYEWVENSDPAMFAEIKERVATGRWQIVGGWWIQPDCNIPCGESFVRQALYAQRYFKEKLGVTARVGYNPDSFGHAGSLPQILKKCGLDYYVFMRPGPHEKDLPSRVFWWEAEDGSRVLAFRIVAPYATWGKDVQRHVRDAAAELKPPLQHIMCFFGVGNHGGGPTQENIASIRRLQGEPDLPEIVFSSPNQFFAAIEPDKLALPVVRDDLQHHASGCYAAHSGVKRWNRQTENLLLAAEKLSAIAAWTTGQPYPDDLSRAWKDVLFCQFHDILAGTSLEIAYDDARNLYGEAMAIAGRALNYAAQSLAWNIRIPFVAGARPIVVFNPHAWPVRCNVEMEFGRMDSGEVLLDDGGQQIAMQRVQSWATTVSRNRISFMADLPALGYRTYSVVAGPPAVAFAPIQASDTMIENTALRLSIDPQTGCIASLYDKQAQREVFSSQAARAVVIDDPSDTWSHAVVRFDQVIGAFSVRSVRLVEHGPVKAVLRAESSYGASTLTQDFTICQNLRQIDVRVSVDWREQCKLLKLRFPVNAVQPVATYEIPYGHIVRPANGEEEPGQSWIDVADDSFGLSILNDGKYSFDVMDNDVGLTVLRSPAYAHHVPAVLQPHIRYVYQDQSVQQFTYSLLPHSGGWQEASVVKRAAVLNQPPWALAAAFHDQGVLPQQASYIDVQPESIVVSAIKKAEDNDDLIIRCYETAGKATRATIVLPRWDRRTTTAFGPGEIKTLRIPKDPALPVSEPSMLEWPQ